MSRRPTAPPLGGRATRPTKTDARQNQPLANMATAANTQAAMTAFQQNHAIPPPWPGMPGMPFMFPNGLLPPLMPPPPFINGQMANPMAPFSWLPLPPFPEMPVAIPSTNHGSVPGQMQASSTRPMPQVDREEGELSDPPTAPLLAQVHDEKKSLVVGQERYRQSVKKQAAQSRRAMNGPLAFNTGNLACPSVTDAVMTNTNALGPSAVQSTTHDTPNMERSSKLVDRVANTPSHPDFSSMFPPEYLAERRENGKKFLLLMHHIGHSYQELSQESVDPLFLKGIYEDLGIPAIDIAQPNSNNLTKEIVGNKPNSTVQESSSRSANGPPGFAPMITPAKISKPTSSPPIASEPDPVPTPQTVVPKRQFEPASENVSSTAVRQSSAVTHAPAGVPVVLPTTLAETTLLKAKSPEVVVSPLASLAAIPQAALPVIDRKDYIARLIAAKTKKVQSQNLSARSPPAVAADLPLVVNHVPTVLVSPSSVDDAVTPEDDHAKKKAKTELIRLRLEALKAIKQKELSKPPDLTLSGSATPIPTLSTSLSEEAGHARRASPTVTAEPLEDMIETVLQQNLKSELRAPIEPYASVDITSTAAPSSSNIQSPFGTTNIPSVLKRPVASDFEDGPSPKVAKGVFGRCHDGEDEDGFIIEVSDDEDAEDSEDVEMTSAEISGYASGVATPASAFYGVRTMALPDRPLSGPPLANRAWQANSSRALGLPQEDVHLKTHENKILEMKRKILEMETKRKAKALASRVASPINSLDTNRQADSSPPVPVSVQLFDGKTLKSPIMEQASLMSSVPPSASPKHGTVLPSTPMNKPEVESLRENSTGLSSGVTLSQLNGSANNASAFYPDNTNHTFRPQVSLTQVHNSDNVIEQEQEEGRRLSASVNSTAHNTPTILQEKSQATKDELDLQRQLARELSQDMDITSEDEQDSVYDSDSQPSMSIDSSEDEQASIPSLIQDESVPFQGHALDETPVPIEDEEQRPDGILVDAIETAEQVGSDSSEPGQELELLEKQDDEDDGEDSSEMDLDDVHGSGDATSEATESANSNREARKAVDPSSSPDQSEPQPALDIDPARRDIDEEEYESSNVVPLLERSPSPDTALAGLAPNSKSADGLSSVITTDNTQQVAIVSNGAQVETTAVLPSHFTPYVSPLSYFKSYRFHPSYIESVAGGFRSLTYSHQIDPHTPMCEYETAGGVCNDDRCEGQHFRSISLADNMMLVQLGTANPGESSEERVRWTEGLKSVIQDLRKNSIKDPEIVASSIATYRRQFLNDPSRVLSLWHEKV